MTFEEIIVKLGLDGSSLDSGLRSAKTGITEFGEHASEHMDRAATSGRMLHRVMHEISQISPLAGAAIMGAFSLPMLAMQGLLYGLKMIKDRFDESKQAAKEAGEAYERALRSTGNPAARARTAKHKMFERKRAGLPAGPEDEQNDITLEAAEQSVTNYENKLEEAKKKEKAGLDDLASAERTRHEMGSSYNDVQMSELQKRIDLHHAEHKAVVDLTKDLDVRKDKVTALQEAEQTRDDAIKKGVKNAQEYAEGVDAIEKWAHDQKETRRKKDEEAAREGVRQTRLQQQEGEIAERSSLDRFKDQERQKDRFRPSVGEMAGYNTPFGNLAKELQLREQQAKFSSTMTTPEGAARLQNLMEGERGALRADLAKTGLGGGAFQRSAERIRDFMEQQGVISPERQMEKMESTLREHLEINRAQMNMIRQGGLPVAIQSAN